eukprot:TRINITY_DN8912_c0_g1_i2.p1 TRINITY_DN8912_c0_g1~~TRINITY_DN8912_c0_g1_i2.p1  ORF type:complete len:126 (-),score=24.42 TRINITY_DN8912_c0_g1_i2:54-431(-)
MLAIENIEEELDGLISIRLTTEETKELFSKNINNTQTLALPAKSSLSELFIKHCHHTQLLQNREKQTSRLETLVSFFKTIQLIQISFPFREDNLYFTIVADVTAKTGVIIDYFRNDIIPCISSCC